MTNPILSHEWLVQFECFQRLFVGFSGGLDSTVLLHLLATTPQLQKKITAIHINHNLSAYAADWQAHCQQICQAFNVPIIVNNVTVDKLANVEESARKARYAIFCSLVHQDDCLLLGHHLNDQAETLLLQLFRGAGVDGLAAMPVCKKMGQGLLFRPLLEHSRETLQTYASLHHLSWVNDESNDNIRFSRNFLRHDLIPLVQSRWTGVVSNLARSASHCQHAASLLEELAIIDYPSINKPTKTLSISTLAGLSNARINNILRVWLKNNNVRLPDTATFNRLLAEAILANADATPLIAWDRYEIRRYQQTLYLLKREEGDTLACFNWTSFPAPLQLNGNSGVLMAIPARQGLRVPEHCNIQVRFRSEGEFLRWHGQTKSLKKLFQTWRIPTWLRRHIPLVYVDDQLAAVVGYAISDLFYQEKSGADTYQLVLRNV